MAVIEIAKIQVRRGDARSTGMPQLDTGEFGWAITGTSPTSTQPQLFVGNKVADGATLTTNTRILTVLDLPAILARGVTTSTYTYTGHKSFTLYTGLGNTQYPRTVQSKLDDYVSLADFGVYSGMNNAAPTIQHAINEIYLNDDQAFPESRIPLRIPAGAYDITATIYIPPYATIMGDGKEKTILEMSVESTPMFQFVDGTSTPGSYVTLDNIGSNSAPNNVKISGMTLRYATGINPDTVSPLMLVDCSTDSQIDDVRFDNLIGGFGSVNNNIGISIRGTDAVTSRNIRITNCVFENIRYGVLSNYDIEDTVIDNNRFAYLEKAIVHAETLVVGNEVGPRRTRITHNVFDTISQEAIKVVGTASMTTNHVSSQNSFQNVGNNTLGEYSGVYSVIDFQTYGNVSSDDYFNRSTEINNTTTSLNFVIPIKGHVSLVDNKVRVVTLAVAPSSGTLLKVGHSGSVTNLKIQYHMTMTGVSRWGDLFVVVANSIVVDVTDNYKFAGTSDGGLIFSAAFNSGTNTISITYQSASAAGTVTYQINQYY